MAPKLKPFPSHLQQFPKNHPRLFRPPWGRANKMGFFIEIIPRLKPYESVCHGSAGYAGDSRHSAARFEFGKAEGTDRAERAGIRHSPGRPAGAPAEDAGRELVRV